MIVHYKTKNIFLHSYLQQESNDIFDERQVWPDDFKNDQIIDPGKDLIDEVCHLREENERLRTVTQRLIYSNEDDDDIEAIEEEIITTKRNPHQPNLPVRISPPIIPSSTFFDNASFPSPAKLVQSIGVGDADVNQYYLLDTGSHSVDPASFPPAYWERLSRYFSEQFSLRRSHGVDAQQQVNNTRQLITSITTCTNLPRLSNFGMNVKPSQEDMGIGTESVLQRDSSCMTDDLDEYFARLLQSILPQYPNADSEFIRQIYRHSRTDVSKFIQRLIARLSELNNAQPPPKPKMESVGCNVRPQMMNKRTSSVPTRRMNLGVNTDWLIQRSQGMMHVPPDVFKRDIACTTSSFIKRVDSSSQISMKVPQEPEKEPTDQNSNASTGEYKLSTTRIRRVLCQRGSTEEIETLKQTSDSGEWSPHPTSSRPMPIKSIKKSSNVSLTCTVTIDKLV